MATTGGKAIANFFVRLGFDFQNEEAVNDFEKRINQASKSIKDLARDAALAAGAFALWLGKTVNEADNLSDTAAAIGVTATSLASLRYAADQMGSSGAEMDNTLINIQRTMGQVVEGVGRGVTYFQKLGLSARDANGRMKPTLEMYLEIANKFQHMSMQQAQGIGEGLGISPSQVMMMRAGVKAIVEYSDEWFKLSGATEAEVQNVAQFQNTINASKAALQGFFTSLASGIINQMRTPLKEVSNWWERNRNNIIKGLTDFIVTLGTALNNFINSPFVKVLDEVAVAIAQNKNYMSALIAVIAGWTFLKVGIGLLQPFINLINVLKNGWVVLTVVVNLFRATWIKTAAMFLIDIGKMIVGLSLLGVAAVMNAAKQIAAWTAVGIAEWLANAPLLVIIGTIALIVAAIAGVVYAVTHWAQVSKVLGDIWDWVKKKAEAFWDWLGDKFKWFTDKIQSVEHFFGMGGGNDSGTPVAQGVATPNSAPAHWTPGADAARGAAVSGAKGVSVSHVDNSRNVYNIHATDPKGTADEIERRSAERQRALIRNAQSQVKS